MSGDDDFVNLECVEDMSNCVDIVNENENEDESEQVEPRVGIEFEDIKEMYEFYKHYAKRIGFPVRKRSSKKNIDGNLRSVTLSCSRSGKHENTSLNPLKPQASYRIGCNARLTARLNRDGRWEISVIELKHNHGISPSKSRFFACNRRISAHVRQQISLNDQSGIRMNYCSLVQEAGGYENMSCGEKDCRNLVEESRRLRLGEGDASAIMKYFSKMVAENSGLFCDIEMDHDDHLKNVFWADDRSREAYKEFGELVEEDNRDEKGTNDEWKNIKDPLSQNRKGRAKKKRIEKPPRKRSNKRSSVHVNNMAKDQAITTAQSQVDFGLQPWGMYPSGQQFTHENLVVLPEYLHAMVVTPMYGLHHLLPGYPFPPPPPHS